MNIISRYFALRKIKKTWKDKVKRKPVCDWIRGCGYYFGGAGSIRHKIGQLEDVNMLSGKVGIYSLLWVKWCNDPKDMVEDSGWQLIGYKGKKPFSEMTFKEYCIERNIVL